MVNTDIVNLRLISYMYVWGFFLMIYFDYKATSTLIENNELTIFAHSFSRICTFLIVKTVCKNSYLLIKLNFHL